MLISDANHENCSSKTFTSNNSKDDSRTKPKEDVVMKVPTAAWREESHSPLTPYGNKELFEDSLHGLPGRIVKQVDRYTEADPAAVLLQLLCMFANCIGLSPHLKIGNRIHNARIYVSVVGGTSTGRKGTSMSVAKDLMQAADEEYVKNCFIKGASTGEGIISAFSSAQGEKKLQIIEEEFSSILSRKKRDGSVMSEVLREGYDSSSFQITNKNSPIKVDNSHLSLIVHITPQELEKTFASVDAANGFANRFIWLISHRSKLLSKGSTVPDSLNRDLALEIRQTLEVARAFSEIKFHDSTSTLWDKLYFELNEEIPGVVGAISARGVVNTFRLALIYALFDKSNVILPAHLEAAYSLWMYSLDCIRKIFAKDELSSLANRIYSEILTETAITKTDLSRALSGHKDRVLTESALEELAQRDLIERSMESTAGRSRELIRRKS